MTDEEKKEFEEFLEWKKQKKEKEEKEKQEEKDKDLSQTLTEETSVSQISSQNVDDKKSKSNINNPMPSKKDSDKIIYYIGAIAFLIMLIPLVVTTCHNSTQDVSYADSAQVDSTADSTAEYVGTDSENYSKSDSGNGSGTTSETGWTKDIETDPMDDSKSTFVSIVSDNSNDVGYPYGDVSAKLLVRKTRKYGTDVIVQTSSGQIYGNPYNDDNYVTIRFDSGKPIRFYYDTSSDGSSETVFLRKKTTFIQNAKKANWITVEIPYFQAGRQVFTFTTEKPLEW